ncbi:MAG: hypothetical protein Q7R95_00070 [bacterium]|nr:hypothetical protein [bacterium]
MEIFFNASTSVKYEQKQIYLNIIKVLEKLGHTVYADHIKQGLNDISDRKIRKNYTHNYKKIVDKIDSSDIMIVESTVPSMAVGHFLTLALTKRMPVLVLYTHNPHGLLIGNPNNLLFFKKYSQTGLDDLKEIIKKWTENVDKSVLKNRFNLMLSPNHVENITKKSSYLKISKAEYIRKLIEEANID